MRGGGSLLAHRGKSSPRASTETTRQGVQDPLPKARKCLLWNSASRALSSPVLLITSSRKSSPASVSEGGLVVRAQGLHSIHGVVVGGTAAGPAVRALCEPLLPPQPFAGLCSASCGPTDCPMLA